MIEKFYEVTCDYCGTVIMHQPRNKPTTKTIEGYGGKCTSTKHFCSDKCLSEWNHDMQMKRYLNLKQNGRIHIDPSTIY